MEPVKFIRDLLYEHDCVIVPGFGAIIGNYVPAHYNRVKSVFQPPTKQIGFNKRLNHNDGLLAGSISREMQIGYVDAKRIVDDFVTGINKKIQKGEVVVFEGIGRFVPDKSKKIYFEQDPTANFLLESFGLASFHFAEREQKPLLRRTDKRFKDIGIAHKDVKKRKFALVAYIGIPVVIAAISLVALYIDANRNLNFEASSLSPFSATIRSNSGIVINKVPEDSKSQPHEYDANLSEMTSKKTALFYEESKTGPDDKRVESEFSLVHYIVAGSFKNFENALNLKHELEVKGFSTEILDFGNDFYRVSLASFGNRDKAIEELYKLRSEKDFASVWLLTK